MKFTVIFLFISLINAAISLKILGILPMGSKSHFAIGNSIIETLYATGHEVTVISPYPTNKVKENYREISLAEDLKKYESEQGL